MTKACDRNICLNILARKGARSRGVVCVGREAALHARHAAVRGEVRARTDVTTDVCLEGLNRPLRGPGKSAEPGS